MAEGTEMSFMNAKMLVAGILPALEPFCERIDIAGSVRRHRPFVNDLDIVLIPKPECVDKLKELCLSWHPGGDEIFSTATKEYTIKWGAKMATFNYKEKIQVDLYFADAHTYPIVFLIRTGSKDHNVWMCNNAKNKGMYLAADGSGVYADRDKQKRILVQTEGDIYGALDLSYLEPEDRESGFCDNS